MLRRAFCIAILNLALLAPAMAQRATLVWENDAIGKTDRDYTQGFRGSVVFDDFARDRLASETYGFLAPGILTFGAPSGPVRKQLEWIVGQSIFTPDRIQSPIRAPGDRPFGGWLYTGVSLAQESAGVQLDSFEILAGAVGGPAGLGRQVQGAFHRLLGQTSAAPGYDLKNEPGLLLAWDRRWRVGTQLTRSLGVDVVPTVGVTVGNVFTYASVGAMMRLGQSLNTTWGPTRVRPSASGASFIGSDPAVPFWGYDVFAGVEARGVARNIFLDGNTFENGISVQRKAFVADFYAGAEVFTQSGFRVAATVTHRTREYVTQEKASLFGSVEGSFRF